MASPIRTRGQAYPDLGPKGSVTIQCGIGFFFLRQGVRNLGAESGVIGRTRLLPRTLAHALIYIVLDNTLPTGHETPHVG